tara:strand:+ start:15327 stop:16139 length:813 start_codon:yes stop_codon:yes gene_type:complete
MYYPYYTKTMKHLYIVAFLCFTAPFFANAQVGGSVFETVKKAQNEAKGEADNAADEAQEAEDLENFEKGLSVFSEELIKVSDKPMIENCLSIMVNHGYQLFRHQGLVVRAEECKVKKELLEAQALHLLSAGTKFFCPDELYSDIVKYSEEITLFIFPDFYHKDPSKRLRQSDVAHELMRRHQLTGDYFNNPYRTNLEMLRDGLREYFEDLEDSGFAENEDIWYDIANEQGDDYQLALKALIDYFTYYLSPEFMVKRANEIEKEIKALPCK